MPAKPNSDPHAARAPTSEPTSPDATASLRFFSLDDEDFALIELTADAPEVAPASIPAPIPGLSDAEARVLAELVSGCSNQEIAKRRGTSLRTISNQVSAILRKLGVESRAQAALLIAGGATPNGDADDELTEPHCDALPARRDDGDGEPRE